MYKHLPKIFIISGFLSVFFIARTNQSGPGPGYSNAPSEDNCGNSSCHNTSLVTSGTNWNRIALRDKFTGSGYIPDSTYELVLTHKETGMSTSGFQITCLDKGDNAAGSFATLDSKTQTMSTSIGGKTRVYLGHTSTGSATINSDSNAYRIQWTAPNKNVGSIKFYAVWNKGNGSGSGGDVIYAKVFSVSPSSLLPSADVKILESNYCQSNNLTFDADVTGSPTTYNWVFQGATPSISSSTAQKPVVSFGSQGTVRAILTLKNNKGTGVPDTLTFTVKASPAATISPSTTQILCNGDSVLLSANAITGATYLWSPIAKTTRTAYFKDSGNYTVKVTGTNGCSRTSAVVVIKVNPRPSVLAVKSFSGDTICSGSPFNIGGFIVSGTADSFSYTAANGPFVKSNTKAEQLIAGSKNYSVWGKASNGCVSVASTLTLFAKNQSASPNINASNIDYTGFRINWNSITDATGYKISLDSGKNFIDPSSGSTGLFHDVTGLLGNHSMRVMVYAITSGICANTDTGDMIITTKSCSPLDFSITASDTRVCKNANAAVVIHKTKGKTIGIKIDGAFVGSDTLQNIKVTGSRNYTISVLDSAALICGYTNQTISLIEDTVGTPALSPSGKVGICSNSSFATLNVIVGPSKYIDSVFYIRNGNKEVSSKSFNNSYTVANNDSVWAVARNLSGCIGEESSKAIVSINPIPNSSFGISNTQFNYTFSATDGTGTHKWKVGSDSSSTINGEFDLTPLKNDTATIVHIVTKNGCTSTTTQKIFVPDFAGKKDVLMVGISIYPNPVSDILNVIVPSNTAAVILDIRNAAGQIVLSARLKPGTNQVFIEGLASGVYLYQVNSNNSETTGSLIIER